MRHPDLTPVMNDALRFSQQGMTTIFGPAGASLAFYHRETGEESDGEGDSAAGDYHLDADRHH